MKMKYYVVFLIASLLWGFARSEIHETKIQNESNIESLEDYLDNYIIESGLFEQLHEVESNATIAEDRNFNEIMNEFLMQLYMRKALNQVRPKFEFIKNKKDILNKSRGELKKVTENAEYRNNARKDDTNKYAHSLNVKKLHNFIGTNDTKEKGKQLSSMKLKVRGKKVNETESELGLESQRTGQTNDEKEVEEHESVVELEAHRINHINADETESAVEFAQKTNQTNVEKEVDEVESLVKLKASKINQTIVKKEVDELEPHKINQTDAEKEVDEIVQNRNIYEKDKDKSIIFETSNGKHKFPDVLAVPNNKITSNVDISDEVKEPYRKSKHYSNTLFINSGKYDQNQLLFMKLIENELHLHGFGNETNLEPNIFNKIDLENVKNDFTMEYSGELFLPPNIEVNDIQNIQSNFIYRPPILIDDSSFDNSSNINYSSSFENDGHIHQISKRRAKKKANKNCPYPEHLNSHLNCTEYETKISCIQTCTFGHAVKEGKRRKQECNKKEGLWKPSRVFSDCKPYVDCTINLRQGGHKYCINYGHKHRGPECRVSCDAYHGTRKVKQRKHVCTKKGRWKPRLPHCAIAGTRHRLVNKP